ncbi:MAG TPA: hypothetical protein VGK04_06810 [Thermoanaerobaculia bacterium]
MPLNAATKVRVKTKVPEGVEISGDTVKVKNGYAFKRVAANKVDVYATSGRAQGRVSGTLSCNCNKGDGGCNGQIDGKGYKCIAASGCNGCTMTVSFSSESRPEVQPVH